MDLKKSQKQTRQERSRITASIISVSTGIANDMPGIDLPKKTLTSKGFEHIYRENLVKQIPKKLFILKRSFAKMEISTNG